MNWDDYQRHDVLNEFIESIADANDFASIIPIGQSYEGRDMKVLAITKVKDGVIKKNRNIWDNILNGVGRGSLFVMSQMSNPQLNHTST